MIQAPKGAMVSLIFGFSGSPPPPSDYDPEEYHRPLNDPLESEESESDCSGRESKSDRINAEKEDLLSEIRSTLGCLDTGFDLRNIEELGARS